MNSQTVGGIDPSDQTWTNVWWRWLGTTRVGKSKGMSLQVAVLDGWNIALIFSRKKEMEWKGECNEEEDRSIRDTRDSLRRTF